MSNTSAHPAVEAETTAPAPLAVSYLRVSTREEAERGGSEEGFSIPAQREANQRKADELGAKVVREFVDAGESARSADRDEPVAPNADAPGFFTYMSEKGEAAPMMAILEASQHRAPAHRESKHSTRSGEDPRQRTSLTAPDSYQCHATDCCVA